VTLLVALRDIGLGVEVLIASLIVQQIIENLIMPRILGQFTGLNPVWVFISILTGARVGGLLGVVVAVPTAVVIKTILMSIRSPVSSLIYPGETQLVTPQGNGVREESGSTAIEGLPAGEAVEG
jgi:predicted PurR-regulated permease PerM